MTQTADLFRQHFGENPDEAKFFWSGGPIEVAERTWFQSMFSGVTGFDTNDGLVLVDTGLQQFSPLLSGQLRGKSDKPIHTAIYTHGHMDHAFGLDTFLAKDQEKPRIIGQRNMAARFARYEQTNQHNAAINSRQFMGQSMMAEAGNIPFGSYPEWFPDTLFEEKISIEVGGLNFDVTHCRGETDDHAWIFCHERRVLCPGDLFIYAVPNAGNPQKVQRYPWDWAKGLRGMAALRPASICPGHGGPVVQDAEKIQQMLLETADYLEAIVAQTLAAMEAGAPPHVDIVHSVKAPESSSPWLQPVYDEAEFIVRNVIRFFGGWWSGRPSELKPAPRDVLASEIAALAGGAMVLAKRAQTLADTDMRLACHLADYAMEAEPQNPEIQEIVAAIYDQREQQEDSLMALNICSSAAAYARAGRPFK
jgi:glyoxylase-like metal-dependent hydrolase (beta-lactamase superfamily II)